MSATWKKYVTPDLLEPERPLCSRCTKPVKAAVLFLAFSSRDGAIVRHRGASRRVRLCRPCCRELLRAFRGRPS